MSGEQLFCIFFVWVYITCCEGITRSNENEKNLIGEEERRGVNIKKDIEINDQKKSETKKHGLWIIGQSNKPQYPTGYDSSGIGGAYHGYTGTGGYAGAGGYAGGGGYAGAGGYAGTGGISGSGGYGITGTGYTYENSALGGYHKGPSYGTGFGHSGGGSNFDYGGGVKHGASGAAFGHSGSGYEGSGYGLSHENDGYKKLSLKKFLIPLAGLALLGAVAAFSNPILLQLGTINGRRRRSIFEKGYQDVYPLNPKVKPEYTN